jgi:hypothetical protein
MNPCVLSIVVEEINEFYLLFIYLKDKGRKRKEKGRKGKEKGRKRIEKGGKGNEKGTMAMKGNKWEGKRQNGKRVNGE